MRKSTPYSLLWQIFCIVLCAANIHAQKSEGGGYLSDDPASSSFSSEALAKQYLFGDWGSMRNQLAHRGVVPTLLLITDPFHSVRGGQQTGAATYNLVGSDVRLDTKRLLGWEGGQFALGGAVNFGTSLTRSYVGNSFPIQLADVSGSQPRLTYLSYTQSLAANRVNLRMGRVSLNSVFGEEFAGSEYFKSFVSVGFDLIPQGVFLNVSGAAGYPHTTWGTRLRYAPAKRTYVQAAAYNADTRQLEGSKHGIDLSLRGPVFAVGEVGVKRFQQNDPRPTGDFKLGGFYTGGTHKTVQNHVIRSATGLYGMYLLGDRQLVRFQSPSQSNKAEKISHGGATPSAGGIWELRFARRYSGSANEHHALLLQRRLSCLWAVRSTTERLYCFWCRVRNKQSRSQRASVTGATRDRAWYSRE